MTRWLSLLLFAALLAPAPARDYYVDNVKGRDREPGTDAAHAVATFSRAVALLAPGDTLHVANNGQPYHEVLRFVGKSGTPAQPIVVEGGDAVITGLEPTALADWTPGPEGTLRYTFTHGKLAPNCCPVLLADGQYVPVQREAGALAPGHYAWADGILTYRPAGAAPTALAVSARDCGVVVRDSSHLIIRHLISEGHWNDGFNCHGDCQDLLCEYVEARYNGDDGFSVHEDIGIIYRHSYTHDNHFGIADICASQSDYYDVRVLHNACGAAFAGGTHRLVDCELRDNEKYQLQVLDGTPSGGVYGTAPDGPFYAGACFVHHATIAGGPVGVQVFGRASAMIMGSTITGCATALKLARGGVIELRASQVVDCSRAAVETTAKGFIQGANTFPTSHFLVDGKDFPPTAWADFLAAIASPANGSTIAGAPVAPAAPAVAP